VLHFHPGNYYTTLIDINRLWQHVYVFLTIFSLIKKVLMLWSFNFKQKQKRNALNFLLWLKTTLIWPGINNMKQGGWLFLIFDFFQIHYEAICSLDVVSHVFQSFFFTTFHTSRDQKKLPEEKYPRGCCCCCCCKWYCYSYFFFQSLFVLLL